MEFPFLDRADDDTQCKVILFPHSSRLAYVINTTDTRLQEIEDEIAKLEALETARVKAEEASLEANDEFEEAGGATKLEELDAEKEELGITGYGNGHYEMYVGSVRLNLEHTIEYPVKLAEDEEALLKMIAFEDERLVEHPEMDFDGDVEKMTKHVRQTMNLKSPAVHLGLQFAIRTDLFPSIARIDLLDHAQEEMMEDTDHYFSFDQKKHIFNFKPQTSNFVCCIDAINNRPNIDEYQIYLTHPQLGAHIRYRIQDKIYLAYIRLHIVNIIKEWDGDGDSVEEALEEEYFEPEEM